MISRRQFSRKRLRKSSGEAATPPNRSHDAAVTVEAMKRALVSPAIWPAFQPLVDTYSGGIIGFEVLARWSSPEDGSIAPSVFIPVAEHYGLINALTRKIVSDACRQAVAWPGSFILAINLSPTQFCDPGLFDFLTATVRETGFPLSRLHVEITESALLYDDDTVRSTIQRFKAVGMGLALDDFGTGFASLTRLHAFPFDKLKIDMSFVRSMQHDAGSRKIVASVIGLGQSLGMTVVAEGVENEEQAAMLRRLGCDVCQGWLFGKPTNGAETGELLKSREQSTIPLHGTNISLFQRVHQLDALYKAAPIGLCFLDKDLRHVSVNNRFAEMFGLAPEDMINRTVHDFMPSKEASHVTSDLARVIGGETVVIEEYRPAESTKAFLIINQRVDDDAGEPIGISVTAIDVTERKTIEAALIETEDHARWSIELSPNIPWSSDANGVVNFMGPTPDLTKRATADRIVDWFDRMHPDDRLRVRHEWLEWIPSGKPFETMFRMSLKDENWQWMLSRAKPQFDGRGRIVKWFGVITEIAAQEELEAKIARYQATYDSDDSEPVLGGEAHQEGPSSECRCPDTPGDRNLTNWRPANAPPNRFASAGV